MFWLEQQWEDFPGDGEGSSCSSALQERTREESKPIHFPLTSLDCLGRGGDGWGVSWVWAQRRGEQRTAVLGQSRSHRGISRNHNPAPRAPCFLQQVDDKEKPQRICFYVMLFNLRTRRGGTELAASLPAALSSCPSCGKRGVDSLLGKRLVRKRELFVWQGWEEGLAVHDCVLCSDPLMLVLQEKCGGSSLMESVAIQCPQWTLGGIACLN